jgi:TatD DNase family protein
MIITDSHCHLGMLEESADSVLQRAHNANVAVFLNVCVDLAAAHEVISFTKHEGVYATVGQHPCSARCDDVGELRDLLLQLVESEDKVVAIGETGLDYYKGYSPAPAVQIASFEAHIEAAMAADVPVVVHSRSADVDTLGVLQKYKGVRFVMHCFGGDVALARKYLDLGGYISFSGTVTFKNALETHEACRFVPLDRLLIETDAPYLAPEPHRGKKNEPALVRLVAERAAELRGESLNAIARATTGNFEQLFSRATKCDSITQQPHITDPK